MKRPVVRCGDIGEGQREWEGLVMKFGDPALPARFWAKVVPDNNGCWAWTGHRLPSGYGQFFLGRVDGRKRTVLAHRAAIAAAKGHAYSVRPTRTRVKTRDGSAERVDLAGQSPTSRLRTPLRGSRSNSLTSRC